MFGKAFKATFGVGCAVVVAIIAIALIGGALASKPAVTTTPTTATPIVNVTTAPGAATTTVPAAPRPTASPVVLRGTGQTATDAITLPAAINVAAFTHTGSRNFVVQVVRGTAQSLLINTIGAYTGTRPLTGTDPLRLQIEADGAWTVTITPIACCATLTP